MNFDDFHREKQAFPHHRALGVADNVMALRDKCERKIFGLSLVAMSTVAFMTRDRLRLPY